MKMKKMRFCIPAAGILFCLFFAMTAPADESVYSEAETEQISETEEETETVVPAPDFTFEDQYGETHTLSDYRGKVVFLNFWATWCPPCKAEMPDIQTLYEKYQDSEEVAILGVAFPEQSGEGTVEEVAQFLEDNGYTYPVVMATDRHMALKYAIQAFPTTFMIDKDGNIFGYLAGMMDYDTMEKIIQLTLEGV